MSAVLSDGRGERDLLMSMKTTILAAALLVGCGDGTTTPNDGSTPVGADAGPGLDAAPAPMTWQIDSIEAGDVSSGWQPSIAVAPNGTIGVAYFRKKDDLGVCMRMASLGAVAQWDILYTSSMGGGAFSTPELVTTVEIINMSGLSLAFDPAGQPSIALMGGMEGMMRCGGTDIVLATKGAGWTLRTLDGNGASTPVFPEDAAACAAAQNVCNQGDSVGEWPALVYHGGAPVVAYRDIHYGWAMNDFDKSDVEISMGGLSTLDASWGGGTFTSMVVDAQDRVQLVHHNKFRENRAHGSGIFAATYANGAWTRKKISDETVIGYRLTFASTGNKLGLAYHASEALKLRYLESADGDTWGNEEVVDQTGNTGLTPSLAFDPAGAPAIAYHSCGPFVPGSTDCPQDKDALRYASKSSGRWKSVDVETSRGGVDGNFTALAFGSDGLPVIVFQATYFDPMSGLVSRHLKVARGRP